MTAKKTTKKKTATRKPPVTRSKRAPSSTASSTVKKPSKKSKAKRGSGQPTKLTLAVQKRIVELVKAGNYYETACKASGIGETTFYRWKARGEKETSGIYREFWEAIQKATSDAEAHHLENISLAADSGAWQASAWYLERKNHERWRRREKNQIEGSISVNSIADLARLTLDD